MSEENFDVVAKELTKLYRSIMLLSDLGRQVKYDQFNDIVTNYLKNKTDRLSYLLEPDYSMQEKDLKLIKDWCEKLHALKEHLSEPHHPINEIKAIFDFFAARIQNYAKNLGENISKELRKTDPRGDFTKIESWLTTLSELKSREIIGIRIYPIYSTSLDSICIELREFKRTAQNAINLLHQNSEVEIDHKRFSEYLSILEEAEWMNKFYENICSDVTKDIKDQILNYAKNIKSSTKGIAVTLKNPENIQVAYEMVSKIKKMEPLVTAVAEIKDEITEVSQ